MKLKKIFTRRFRLIKDIFIGANIYSILLLTIRAILYMVSIRIYRYLGVYRKINGWFTKRIITKVHGTFLKCYDTLAFTSENYEEGMISWFDIYGDTFLDVGANIGRYTIIYADRFKNIIAFEPNRGPYDVLCENIKLNDIDNVIAMNYALWDKFTTLELSVPDGSCGSSTVNPKTPIFAKGKKIFVDACPYDGLNFGSYNFVPIYPLSLVKIDAEGAELEILHGMRKSLERWTPRLIIEIYRLEGQEEKVINYLKDLGYSLQDVWLNNFLFENNEKRYDVHI